jgi:hypothetical protein
MKAMIISPKNRTDFKLLADLFKKLNIPFATMTEDELEDIGLSKMVKNNIDKTKKVSKASIMNKLKA